MTGVSRAAILAPLLGVSMLSLAAVDASSSAAGLMRFVADEPAETVFELASPVSLDTRRDTGTVSFRTDAEHAGILIDNSPETDPEPPDRIYAAVLLEGEICGWQECADPVMQAPLRGSHDGWRLELPPGRYRVTLMSAPPVPVEVSLRGSGIEGEVEVVAVAPSQRWSVRPIPEVETEGPVFTVRDGIVAGNADPGTVMWMVAWLVNEVGAWHADYLCQGPAETFEPSGRCTASTAQRRSTGLVVAGQYIKMLSRVGWVGTSLLPGPVLQGYRFETTAVRARAMGLAITLDLGPSS